MPFWAWVLSAVLTFCAAPYAQAQDKCSDVLREGVMKRQNVESTIYSKLAYLAYLKEMTKEEWEAGKNNHDGDMSLFGGVVDLEIVNTNTEKNAFIHEIEKSIKLDSFVNNTLELATTGGDENILDAWTQCMTKAKGTYLFVADVAPFHDGLGGQKRGQARLTIYFDPPGNGLSELTIKEIKLPPKVSFMSADEEEKFNDTHDENGEVESSKFGIGDKITQETRYYIPIILGDYNETPDEDGNVEIPQYIFVVDFAEHSPVSFVLPRISYKSPPVEEEEETLAVFNRDRIVVPSLGPCNPGSLIESDPNSCKWKSRLACLTLGMATAGVNHGFIRGTCAPGSGKCTGSYTCGDSNGKRYVFESMYPCTATADANNCANKAKQRCRQLSKRFAENGGDVYIYARTEEIPGGFDAAYECHVNP